MTYRVPVIDLFSGPGGLSEGFSRFGARDWASVLPKELSERGWSIPADVSFEIKLSVEKDSVARRTLKLRAFLRQFQEHPAEYQQVLKGELSPEELYSKFKLQADVAEQEAWEHELGTDRSAVDRRIADAVRGHDLWCLIGGPPCQAYSLVGRARRKGIKDYRPEADKRHFLYEEYLRIVARHAPAVFVMENVKGILSSKVGEQEIFKRIVEDLSLAGQFSEGLNEDLEYEIRSFVADPVEESDGKESDGKEFIIRAEDYGIPQARHRVILLGVRRGLDVTQVPKLVRRHQVTVEEVLHGLPRLRSAVSRRGAGDRAETLPEVLAKVPTSGWFAALAKKREVVAAKMEAICSAVRTEGVRGSNNLTPRVADPEYMTDWFVGRAPDGITNHEARRHMASDLHRYLFAACFAEVVGISPRLEEFPKALLPKHESAKSDEGSPVFNDRFRVQLRDRPATTVTSHISKDGHYYIHPDPKQVRSLTVREAARIQTFPDDYYFCGTRTEQYHQVGNAVPPLLAVQLAGVVARIIADARDSRAIGKDKSATPSRLVRAAPPENKSRRRAAGT
jgi:DNA (cytosine-5)-methyltransferase 1